MITSGAFLCFSNSKSVGKQTLSTNFAYCAKLETDYSFYLVLVIIQLSRICIMYSQAVTEYCKIFSYKHQNTGSIIMTLKYLRIWFRTLGQAKLQRDMGPRMISFFSSMCDFVSFTIQSLWKKQFDKLHWNRAFCFIMQRGIYTTRFFIF